MGFVVGIDGPAGSGKGTVTKKIANKLGLINIDTGITYRCVALEVINQNINIQEEKKIIDIAKNINIKIDNTPNGDVVYLNGENVSEKIRSKEVSSIVSPVSSIKEVRYEMVKVQRKLAEGKDVIMEGRDICTYVFPNADIKIYLDASIEERARRRYKEMKEKGIIISYEEVRINIEKRDLNDMSKEVGALKIAPNSIVIDSTNKTINEVVEEIIQIIKKQYIRRNKMRVLIKSIFWLISVFMYRIKIKGKENIPKEGAILICPNHVHALDSAIIIAHSKRKINVLAKADLFTGFVKQWFANLFGIYPIKQDSADIDAIKTSLRVLKNGEPLMIFPEGTRNGLAKGTPLKNGPVILAIKSNTPIIPVGIKGNFKLFSRIRINIGKPIEYSEYKGKIKDKDLISNLTKQLMEEVVNLRDI